MDNKYCARVLGTFVFLSALATVACNHYYRVVPAAPQVSSIDSLHRLIRFFVLRSGTVAYHMSGIQISQGQKTLTCALDTLPAAHSLHLRKGRKGNLKYSKSAGEHLNVLNEVHFFTSEDALAAVGDTYTLNLDRIKKIEVLQHDAGRTTGS